MASHLRCRKDNPQTPAVVLEGECFPLLVSAAGATVVQTLPARPSNPLIGPVFCLVNMSAAQPLWPSHQAGPHPLGLWLTAGRATLRSRPPLTPSARPDAHPSLDQ